MGTNCEFEQAEACLKMCTAISGYRHATALFKTVSETRECGDYNGTGYVATAPLLHRFIGHFVRYPLFSHFAYKMWNLR